MSLFRSIIQFFYPCIHTWKTEVSSVNEEGHGKMILTCEMCGEIKEHSFVVPIAPHDCKAHGHRWEDQKSTEIVGDYIVGPSGEKTAKRYTKGYEIFQKCRECGEWQVVRLEPRAKAASPSKSQSGNVPSG